MFAALHRHDGALAETALEGIAEAERATLLDLLERVRANLEAGQG
jgi:DNA-binding MarR family transcriptional regulator